MGLEDVLNFFSRLTSGDSMDVLKKSFKLVRIVFQLVLAHYTYLHLFGPYELISTFDELWNFIITTEFLKPVGALLLSSLIFDVVLQLGISYFFDLLFVKRMVRKVKEMDAEVFMEPNVQIMEMASRLLNLKFNRPLNYISELLYSKLTEENVIGGNLSELPRISEHIRPIHMDILSTMSVQFVFIYSFGHQLNLLVVAVGILVVVLSQLGKFGLVALQSRIVQKVLSRRGPEKSTNEDSKVQS